MSTVDVVTPPRKPITDRLKPVTDRVTREPAEHPDRIPGPNRIPGDPAPHPVTGGRPVRRRERIGAD